MTSDCKQTEIGEIPKDWEVKSVNDVTEYVTDYVANGSFASLKEHVHYNDKPDHAILIRLVDFNNNFTGAFVYVNKEGYEYLKKTKLHGGEIVISNVGEYAGTVFRVPYLDLPMTLGPNSITLKTRYSDDFYYYWFKSIYGQTAISNVKGGSTVPKFNKTDFKTVLLPLPPIKEQQQIASILSSLDDKIELNRKMNKTLEEMAKALFKHWFGDFEFPNEEGKPYKSSGGEMVETELGKMPTDWVIGNLKNFVTHIKETVNPSDSPNESFIHYSLPSYDEGRTPIIETGANILSNKYKIVNRSFLISKLNPFTPRIWTIINPSNNSICSTEFQVLQAKNDQYFSFVYSILNSSHYTSELASKVQGTSNSHQRVKPEDILNIPNIVPDERVVKEYDELIYPLLLKIESNYIEIGHLSVMRDSLLPKLMSGKIRVK